MHLVLSQSSRLVRSNHIDGAQMLDCCQLFDYHLGSPHFARVQPENNGQSNWQSKRHVAENNRQWYWEESAQIRREARVQIFHPGKPANDQSKNGRHGNNEYEFREFVDFFLQSCLLLGDVLVVSAMYDWADVSVSSSCPQQFLFQTHLPPHWT